MNFKVLIIIIFEILLIILEQSFEYRKVFVRIRKCLNQIMKYLFIIDIGYFIVIYLGLNNIKDFNICIKNAIHIFATEEETIEYCKNIKNFLLSLKYIAKDFFVYYMFYILLKYISYDILHILQKKNFEKEILENSENELYKNLYHYLSNKKDIAPILLTGAWGSGKTYTINNFIDKYYRYSSKKIVNNQKIYKISCFGITTKENFLETIRTACKNADNGIFNKTLDIIEKIPIIGNFLKKVLEKRYDINSLKENSIFIFDNFERIAPYIEVKDDKGEIIEIKNEYDILSKYNIVTSIIDELIEKYNMKVIIVTDATMMKQNYIQDVFIFKLGCMRYNIKKSGTIFKEIWNRIIESDKRLQKCKEKLEKVYEQINQSAQRIWEVAMNENVRILRKCLYNYIFFYLYLLENEYEFDEQNNEILGIFYTNLIVNISNITDNQNFFKEIIIGQNIAEYTMLKIDEIEYSLGTMSCFNNVDAMWYAKEMDYQRWRNLEQNHFYIMYELNKTKQIYNYSYITKFNYKNKEIIEGKEINFDILCKIIHYNDEISLNLAKEILEKSKITFEYSSDYNINDIDFRNIHYINKMILQYNIVQILKKNKELLELLFKMLEKDLKQFSNNINLMSNRYQNYNIGELQELQKIYFNNINDE